MEAAMSEGVARAFVTGGTGFTGGRLVEILRERGQTVTALARPASRTDGLQRAGAHIVAGDLRKPAEFEAALDGVDVVYHIAAAFREARLSDRDYHEINATATVQLVEAAARHGVKRFVHCSTVGVHGDTGRTRATEESPLNPPDVYCRSKLEGEQGAREAFARLRLDGVVFRPLGMYGPGDLRFLKLFRGIRRGKFYMIGSGETLYQLTYIDDLCDGIIRCGTLPQAVGQTFILGGTEPMTLNTLVAAVAEATGGKLNKLHIPMGPVLAAAVVCEALCKPLGIEPPLYPRRVEFFSKDRAFDFSKARRVLGYAPQVTLREGLTRTAEWYRASGLL
jgi:nucleoside-diphosphate-sugar epimerase